MATETAKTHAGRAAYNEAKAEILKRHQAEFEAVHGDARERHGLPRVSASKTARTPEQLRAQILRAQARIEGWMNELNGTEPA